MTAHCAKALLALAWLAGDAYAQGESETEFAFALPYLETIATDEIPQSLVTSMAEDAQGLLWIGSQQGLVRYDGYRFRVFRHAAADPRSITSNNVQSLAIDPSGRVWVGMRSDGVSVYDAACECFPDHYRHDPRAPSLGDGSVYAIAHSDDGSTWFGTDSGLSYLAPDAAAVDDAAARWPGLTQDSVHAVLAARDGALWVGTASSLLRRPAGGERFEPVDLGLVDDAPPAGVQLRSLFEAADGKIWLGTRFDGAGWVASDESRVHWLVVDPSRADRLPHPFISSIGQPRPQEIWLGSHGAGLTRVDAADGRVLQQLRREPALVGGLGHDRLGALLRDRSGLFWVGLWGGGLQRYNPQVQAMRSLRQLRSQAASLSHADVTAIVERGDGQLLLGTSRNGIDMIDRRSGLVGGLRDPALSRAVVNAIAEAADGTLWVGNQAGLHRIGADGSVERTFGPADGLAAATVTRLMFDRDGHLWVASSNGLARSTADTSAFVTVATDGIANPDIRSLAQDPTGRIWGGSMNGGLLLAEPGSDRLKAIRRDPQRSDSLSSDTVNGLLVDRDGRLWVDTAQGLDRLLAVDGESASFEHISTMAGHPGLYFGGNLLQDRRGRIWTQWHVLDPQGMRVHALGPADGVDIGTAWVGSYASTRDGLFLFGGTEGVLVIDPEAFEPWRYTPPVIATELKINGRSEPLGSIVPQLRLDPSRDQFSLEFAALDYLVPRQNRYAYRLLGQSEDWIETDAEHRIASYGGLRPGDYTLEVRGSGRSGDWSPELLRIPIRVAPAWFQTTWFKAFAVAGVLGLGWIAVHWRTLLLRSRARELRSEVETRTRELSASLAEVEQLNQQVSMLGEIGQEITATLDVGEIVATLDRHVHSLLDATVFSIYRLDDDAINLRSLLWKEEGQYLAEETIPLLGSPRYAARCARERCELSLDFEPGQDDPSQVPGTVETLSCLFSPMLVGDRLLGVMTIQSPRRHAYGERERQIFRTLCAYGAIALDNAVSYWHLHASKRDAESAHARLVSTQQQLVMQEKMAALGTLTAGVAHEINNPTNFADGAVQQLQAQLVQLHQFLRDLAGSDAPPRVLEAIAQRFGELKEMTDTAREGHERIKRIVRDLRQFTRLDEAERKVVPIADSIQSTVNLVRTRYDRIRFELDLGYNPAIECQPAKLGQVFMNLVVNACQAIAECRDGREGVVRVTTQARDGAVEISVADNGAGMDAATRQHVFEPFFTTKDVGAGTGLGLAIVFGIVRDHGGSIEVESTLGMGTRFVLALPLTLEHSKTEPQL